MARLILKTLIFTTLSLLPYSCGNSSNKDSSGGVTPDSTKLSAAFATNCASCHGATGSGGSGAKLQGYSKSAATFLSVVRSGNGSMRSFSASEYSDADGNADVAYLKTL